MEACAIAHGRTPTAGVRAFWYQTNDPAEPNPELVRIALTNTRYDHFGVGVWYAEDTHAFTVVIFPERSAASEAFRSHLYVTDDFEYVTPFTKGWRRVLPDECKGIRH